MPSPTLVEVCTFIPTLSSERRYAEAVRERPGARQIRVASRATYLGFEVGPTARAAQRGATVLKVDSRVADIVFPQRMAVHLMLFDTCAYRHWRSTRHSFVHYRRRSAGGRSSERQEHHGDALLTDICTTRSSCGCRWRRARALALEPGPWQMCVLSKPKDWLAKLAACITQECEQWRRRSANTVLHTLWWACAPMRPARIAGLAARRRWAVTQSWACHGADCAGQCGSGPLSRSTVADHCSASWRHGRSTARPAGIRQQRCARGAACALLWGPQEAVACV